MLRAALLILICVLAEDAALAGPVRPADRFYDIPAMPLRQALERFAREADLSVALDGVDLKGVRSNYLYGRMDASVALRTLLARTPFDYKFVAADAVRLVPRAARPSSKSTASPQSALDDVPILVTATKREVDVQKIPGSVTAVDGEVLRQWGVRDFNQMAPAIAGVAYTNLGPSRDKIFLRGVSDGAFADRTQMTVGVYLDETPIIFNDTNPDLRLIDIDRVEVLRGPQGSLYGSGSLGGIIRIITNKPDVNRFSARLGADASFTQDGGLNEFYDMVANAPLARGRMGLRASGYYERAHGYIDDVRLGIDDVNRSVVYGGRAALRAKFSDRWTLDIASDAQSVDLTDTQYTFAELGDLSRANFRREPYSDEFRHASLTLNGDIGPAKITSSSAYIHRDIVSAFDATAALGALLDEPDAAGVYRTDDAIRTFNHESRIVSDSPGRLQWIAGLFFSLRTEELGARLIVDSVSPAELPFVSSRRDRVRETALFGEATYEIIPKLKVTAGFRWSATKYSVSVDSGGSLNAVAPSIKDSKRRFAATPKFALSYEATDNLLLYALSARGSRIGGFNVNSPLAALGPAEAGESTATFESDGLWSTELGLKSVWFDGRMIFNAAGFYIRWSNIQTDQILPNGFSFIANAGMARNFGFEGELTARPLSWLQIASAFTVNDPELVQANPFLGAKPGDALPNIASVSAAFSAVADFPIAANWRGAAAFDYHIVGRSYLTFAEAQSPRMGGYGVANLRLTANRDAVSGGFYVKNLFNEYANTFSFGNPFSLSLEAQATPLRPRTAGFFVRLDF